MHRLAVVAALLVARAASAAHTWPLSNSATPDTMNTSFGPRMDFSHWDFHDGIDLPAAIGTPCYAVADGVIHKAGPGGTENYSSRHVVLKEIQASGTTLYFQYLHLNAIAPGIAEGATIAQGSYLGDVGMDDAAYSHLHFEVRRNGGNQDMSVHLLEELPHTDTANFTAPVADRFSRYNALMAARLLFDAPSKEEPDLIRVEVDLKNGATVVATRYVDFDDKASISEVDTDDGEFTNDIAVEGYQSSDMPSDGFYDLKEGVLVRNLPANCDGLVARVKDLGGHVVTSATVPVPVQAGVDVTATFETGSSPPGWTELKSATGTGTTLYAEQSSAREGAWGLTCIDNSNSEFALQSAAVEYPLPAGRFEWTAEAWINPASLSLPSNNQAVYLLEFVNGANLSCAAYVRNASGTLTAGIAGNKPGGVLGGIDSPYVVTPGEWHHWRLTMLHVGTRTTDAILSIDGVEQRRYQWSTTEFEPTSLRAGNGLSSPGTTSVIRCDSIHVTEGDNPPFPSFAPPAAPALTVDLTQSPATPAIGQPVMYVIVLTNTSTAYIQSIALTDTVSALLVGQTSQQVPPFAAPVVTPVGGGGTRYIWSAGSLAVQPGARFTFTVTGFLSAICGATTVSNTALVTAIAAGGTAATQSTPASFAASPPASVITTNQTMTPSAPGRGGDVRYQIVVTNTGTATLTSLTLVDTIPTAIPRWTVSTEQPAAFVPPVLADIASSGTRFTWSGGVTMAPGVSFTFTVWGMVAEVCAATDVTTAPWVLANSACTSGSATGNAVSFSLVPPVAAYTAVKEQVPASGATVNAGDPVTYRTVVTNTGSATLFDLTVVDTVSPLIVSGLAMTPSAYLSPSVVPAGSGTRFVWGRGPLTWAPRTALPTAREGLAAGVVNGRLYAVGGNNPSYLSTVEEYDPGTNTWAARAAMPTAREVFAAGVVNGRLYAVGGFNGSELSTVEVYDPGTNTWATRASMLAARQSLAAGVVNGRLYAVGGFNGTALSSVEEYDPGTDTWGAKASMPTARSGLAAAVVNGRLYAVGGFNGLPRSTVEAYDPGTDTWAAKASMPTARYWLAAGAVNGRLLAMGGYDTGYLNTVEAYDPGTDAWGAMATLPVARNLLAAGVMNGRLCIAGGRDGSPMSDVEEATPGLAPGATLTFTITGQAGAACAATPVSNTAWVNAGDGCVASVALTNRTDLAILAPAVAFTAAKTQVPASPVIGDIVTYQIIVTNTGGATITNLDIVDTVSPVLLGQATAQPAPFTAPTLVNLGPPGGTRYEWSAAGLTVSPGASLTFTVTGSVGPVASNTVVSNTTYVIASTACSMQAKFTNVVGSLIQAAQIGLTVAKQQAPPAGSTVAPGTPITYRIVVTNSGSATVTQLVVDDTLAVGTPSGVATLSGVTTAEPAGFAPAVVTSVASGTRYEWNQSGLTFGPNQTYTFTVTGVAALVCLTSATSNTAFVAGYAPTGSALLVTNATGFTLPAPALTISAVKTQTPANPGVGEPVTYRVDVTNTGGATITTLTVTDTVQAQVSGQAHDEPPAFAGPVITQLAPAGSGTRYAWSAAGLSFQPGQTLTFTVTGRIGVVCGRTTVSNTAYVTAAMACAATTATTPPVGTVVAAPTTIITVTKSHLPAAPVPAGTVAYAIIVANTGTNTVTGLIISDTLPAGVTYTPASQTNTVGLAFNQAGQVVGWSGALTLSPGASVTATVDATVGCAAVSTVNNDGYAAASNACGTVKAKSAGDVFALPALGLLTVAAMSVSPAAPIGQPLTVSLTVSNTGGRDVTGVSATLYVTAGASLVRFGTGPGGGLTLTAGSSTVLVWTFTGTASGDVVLTGSATGTTCAGATSAASNATGRVKGRATLVTSLAVDKDTVREGDVVTVTVTVVNAGDGLASSVASSLTFNDSALAGVTTAAAGGVTVAAGAKADFPWKITARKAGALTVTAGATGVNAADSAALTAATASVTATIEPKVVVEANSIVAAPNVLDAGTGGKATFYLRGTASGSCEIRIFDAAGLSVRRIPVTLDANGEAAVPYDGRDGSGKPLGEGTYWALPVGGGVKGKKPFMIAGKP